MNFTTEEAAPCNRLLPAGLVNEFMTSAAPVTVSVRIAADLARFWNALVRPEAIKCWISAIPERHCQTASSDLRVGGSFSCRMEARWKCSCKAGRRISP